MRTVVLALGLALGLTLPVQAQQIESIYTDIDFEADCTTFAAGEMPDAGPWRFDVCPGFGGYPVLAQVFPDNGSLYFGFPPQAPFESRYASFRAPNRPGGTIEWRVMREGRLTIPFATIHRWFVAAPGGEVEVLVVQKVGQMESWSGCIVGYVVASGVADANEKAREIADDRAIDADACLTYEPDIVEGTVPLPERVFFGFD